MIPDSLNVFRIGTNRTETPEWVRPPGNNSMKANAVCTDDILRDVWEHAPQGLALSAPDGRWLRSNPALRDLLGWSEEALVVRSYPDLLHAEDRAEAEGELEGLRSGHCPCLETEKRLLHRDGHVVWAALSVSVVPGAAGRPARFVWQVRDNAPMAALRDALERTTTRLERTRQDFQQFAGAASHDLREPLRAVAGYAERLRSAHAGKLDGRADEWIGHMVGGVRRLERLIDDLLDFARAGAPDQSRTPTDSAAALRDAWDSLRERVAETGARLESGTLPEVMADRTQLTCLFRHLLDNALRFHGPDSPVVRVAAGKRADMDRWDFSVEDNGIGIEPRYRARIFGVFQRVGARDGHDGTGIGLAVCKRIVEVHGGDIGVDSVPGRGSVFRFSLPSVAAFLSSDDIAP